jgi:hypothetical protein
MKTTSKKTSKLSPAQKAWVTRRANAGAGRRAALRAWATRREIAYLVALLLAAATK